VTDASPAILSIAVLAAFVLALGGGWLIAGKRDRKRGILMIVMAVVLIGNVLIWAAPVKAAAALPADVAAFVERRDACDHWRGEEPYDPMRAIEIARAIRETCTGSDRALKTLRRKYRADPAVLRRLTGYDAKIE
jgi:hypothetical protein